MTYRDVILNHHYFLIMLENEKIITFPFCCTTQYQIECVITYWAVLPSSSFLFFLNNENADLVCKSWNFLKKTM